MIGGDLGLEGPVLVTVEYDVPCSDEAKFRDVSAPGAPAFDRRCESNSGRIWCDRPWNPRACDRSLSVKGNNSRNSRHPQ